DPNLLTNIAVRRDLLINHTFAAFAWRIEDAQKSHPWNRVWVQIVRQVRSSGQSQHRCIVAPEYALQCATVIVQRPLVHRAALPIVRKEPERNFELLSRERGHLDVDR